MASGEPPVGVRLRPIFVSPGCNRASGRHWREPDAAPATTRPPNAVCAGAERRTRDGRGGAGWDQDSRQCQLSQEHASKNPAMVRDNRHDSVHLFGAICPARCTGAAIITPVVNTEAMNEQLKEISTQVGFGAHAVVCDGAGWHQPGCSRACQPITLLPCRLVWAATAQSSPTVPRCSRGLRPWARTKCDL